jgi:hypothetical protein
MSELLQEIIEPILGKLSHPVLRPKSDAYRMCAQEQFDTHTDNSNAFQKSSETIEYN